MICFLCDNLRALTDYHQQRFGNSQPVEHAKYKRREDSMGNKKNHTHFTAIIIVFFAFFNILHCLQYFESDGVSYHIRKRGTEF